MFLTSRSKVIKQIVSHLSALTALAAQSKIDVDLIKQSVERLDALEAARALPVPKSYSVKKAVKK